MSEATPTRVVEQARDALAAFVKNAPDGTKLPPERQLAQRLGVSRTTLRDGVSRLALLGLLEVRHGDGTYVRSPTAAQLAPLLRPLVDGKGSTTIELFELKRHLEPAVAELAAMNCSEAQAANLRAAVQRDRSELAGTTQVAKRTTRRVSERRQLHELIAESAGESLLVALLSVANELLTPHLTELLSHSQRRLAVEQLSAVVEAIAAGDAEAARDATELYLSSLARAMRNGPNASAAVG
ncbi:MAG TPA: GntR family transcriptional regulator [Trueperaceae bacterium]|nr:GntR family transcriptional regulator [Trueperaceae bacterium]